MKSIKLFVKTYKTKTGATFAKATINGKYLPLAKALNDTYYTVKPIGEKIPEQNGFYEISYNKNDLWIDERPEFEERHIVRVRPVRIVKIDELKEKESKDTTK